MALVNVASVPQRSPFRYPGGKTWLVPTLRKWLRGIKPGPAILVEPFTGGGIVGLTSAFEDMTAKVTMAELDGDVAAVWKTVLSADAVWLANRICEFDLTVESALAVLSESPVNVREKAFKTVLRNRVSRGGILAPGGGMIKAGENGRGVRSRWYPETLKTRILNIYGIRDRIEFTEGDGVALMRAHAHRPDCVFFIDPPYTAGGKCAGARLYKHNELDHEELFNVASSVKGDFLMTYENSNDVIRLAQRFGFHSEAIPMKNTHHKKMTELLITRRPT